MKLGRKLAVVSALTIGSGFLTIGGQAAQKNCFESLEHTKGVDNFSELPDRVVDDSGCLNWANTIGLLGVVGEHCVWRNYRIS